MNSEMDVAKTVALVWSNFSRNIDRFTGVICALSRATGYIDTMREWRVSLLEDTFRKVSCDSSLMPRCVCSHYCTSVFSALNVKTGATIFVGKECIERFRDTTRKKRKCANCKKFNIDIEKPSHVKTYQDCRVSYARKCISCKAKKIPLSYPKWKRKCSSCDMRHAARSSGRNS